MEESIERGAKSEERRVESRQKKDSGSQLSALSSQLSSALDHCWAGQCNCAYWHGVFGGLYLPILRQAIYRNLIDAENILDTVEGREIEPKDVNSCAPKIEMTDFNQDGEQEIIVEADNQNCYFSPHQGGAILEWDFKPVSVNVGNVLTRRWESYHKKLKKGSDQQKGNQGSKSIHDMVQVKEKGLENILNYDWYQRVSLIDHFFHPSTSPANFYRSQYGEQGDFVLGRYSAKILNRDLRKDGSFALDLSRDGVVWDNDKRREIRVDKQIVFPAQSPHSPGKGNAEIQVRYRITNLSKETIDELWFGTELNFAFSVFNKEKDKSFSKLKQWKREDPYLFWKLTVEFSDETDGWVLPLETVSNSEGGYEKTFQGIIFVPHWKFPLPGKKTFERTLTLTLEKI